jgi:hypothetical protein
MAQPEKIPTHCMMFLPVGLRRISGPHDDHVVITKGRPRRLALKLAAALRPEQSLEIEQR